MKQIIRAELISIGNELLSGITLNSNAAWLGQKLTQLGVEVNRVTVIADAADEIEAALQTAGQRADVVICTGGLGPTSDDLTRQGICQFFNTNLILDSPTLEKIKNIFDRRNIPMPEVNRVQAMVPQTARLLINPIGTAPGFELEKEGTVFYFLPGVPLEMKSMLEQIIPEIRNRFSVQSFPAHVFRTTGLPESKVYEMIATLLNRHPEIQVSFLPKTSGIDIRLKIYSDQPAEPVEFQQCLADIRSCLRKYIYSENEESLAEVIGNLLSGKKMSLAVAESFTGGLVSDWITAIPGSSAYFSGSVITYSDMSKMDLLKVPPHTLEKYGAVSEQTAGEMVRGARDLFQADCTLATTGIAGPGGATENKPVGLSYVAALYREEIRVKKFQFGQDRQMNKERGAAAVLELLRRMLLHIE
jgi:nicotinamide-nucleotide amidase